MDPRQVVINPNQVYAVSNEGEMSVTGSSSNWMGGVTGGVVTFSVATRGSLIGVTTIPSGWEELVKAPYEYGDRKGCYQVFISDSVEGFNPPDFQIDTVADLSLGVATLYEKATVRGAYSRGRFFAAAGDISMWGVSTSSVPDFRHLRVYHLGASVLDESENLTLFDEFLQSGFEEPVSRLDHKWASDEVWSCVTFSFGTVGSGIERLTGDLLVYAANNSEAGLFEHNFTLFIPYQDPEACCCNCHN